MNVEINSGSTSGVVSRDPSTANHAISNDFDTNEAGEILSLTNSFEKSVKAAYKESNAVKAMPSNKNLTDQERIENDKK
ncbi:hypothetical protein [Komagataeibacter nataicola]|uniref:hypothetical protein n=1 Tax=Komagataeibacter nataicola TaxID=265960 RepID=UPI001475CACC|nr:hypothetical protein [Komagataeibacter nataicola]